MKSLTSWRYYCIPRSKFKSRTWVSEANQARKTFELCNYSTWVQAKQPSSFEELKKKAKQHAEKWFILQYSDSKNIGQRPIIRTFTAMNRYLQNQPIAKTKIAFTPIVPFVVTDYDTIHTMMSNFQDVLRQKTNPTVPFGAMKMFVVWPKKFSS